jgi:hypothetical protein
MRPGGTTGAGGHPRPAANIKAGTRNHNVVRFPRQARRKYPPYAGRVAAIRRTADDRTLTILTGSGAMNEAECRYHDDWGRLDEFDKIKPQTMWAALPYERNPSGYEWDFCARLDVAIVTFGRPETDVSLLHLAGVVLAAGAAHVVVRLAARIEILRRDDRGAIWRMH